MSLALAGMVFTGYSSSRRAEKRWHGAVPMFIAAVGMGMGPLLHDSVGHFAGVCLAGIGVYSAFGVWWSYPTTFLSGAAAAGAIGLVNSFGNVGGFLGPYLTGKSRISPGRFKARMAIWRVRWPGRRPDVDAETRPTTPAARGRRPGGFAGENRLGEPAACLADKRVKQALSRPDGLTRGASFDLPDASMGCNIGSIQRTAGRLRPTHDRMSTTARATFVGMLALVFLPANAAEGGRRRRGHGGLPLLAAGVADGHLPSGRPGQIVGRSQR